MTINSDNGYAAALETIKRTPVGESNAFHKIPFFRETRWIVSFIENGQIEEFDFRRAAEELVRRNLKACETQPRSETKP